MVCVCTNTYTYVNKNVVKIKEKQAKASFQLLRIKSFRHISASSVIPNNALRQTCLGRRGLLEKPVQCGDTEGLYGFVNVLQWVLAYSTEATDP